MQTTSCTCFWSFGLCIFDSKYWIWLSILSKKTQRSLVVFVFSGGGSRIWTRAGLWPLPVFETGPFNHLGIPPCTNYYINRADICHYFSFSEVKKGWKSVFHKSGYENFYVRNFQEKWHFCYDFYYYLSIHASFFRLLLYYHAGVRYFIHKLLVNLFIWFEWMKINVKSLKICTFESKCLLRFLTFKATIVIMTTIQTGSVSHI